MTEAVFETQGLPARGQMADLGARLLPVVRMQQPLRGLADQIRFRPAERRSPGRIDAETFALEVGDDQQVLRHVPDLEALLRLGLDALLERLVELAQRLLGFDLLGDVGVGAEPANNVAGLVADRQSAREEPAVGAVAAAQGKRVLPGVPVSKLLPDVRDDTMEMVGMVQLLPSPPLHLFMRRSGIVVPTLVVPISTSRTDRRSRQTGSCCRPAREIAPRFRATPFRWR